MLSEFIVSFKRSLSEWSENLDPSKSRKLDNKSSESSSDEEESDFESNSESDTSCSESELNFRKYRVRTCVLIDT